jgi:catechol 2,3-dioxygenase-like lactoylglutathione lyase family enzyme
VIDAAVLDHVAIAVERWEDAWPRYVTELGGRWVSGGESIGFAPGQVRYANGMRVEVLRPHAVEQNDFLRRFLDRTGPGVHHLTFKVPDLAAALRAAEAAGITPVGVDLSDPGWKEAFLHPKEAQGVVVQLAEAYGEWSSPPPPGMPEPATQPSSLDHVAHAVADLDDGLALFAGLLGGEEQGRGEDEGGRWVDLAWPGPGRVRVVAPTAPTSPVAQALDGRPGRVFAITFTVPSLPPGPPTVVDPAENFGVRLVLRPPSEG